MESKKKDDIFYKGFNTPVFKIVREKDIKYFIGDMEIKEDDSGERMTFSQFEELVKKEVLKKVNKSFNNIVVLAGAGASIVGEAKGKTVATLYQELSNILDGDEAKEESYSFKKLNELGIISSDDVEKQNLENILSKLIKTQEVIEDIPLDERKLNKTMLKNTITKIKKYIYRATSCYEFDDSCKHDVLIKKLSNRLPNSSRLNIVTTNYDRLFEGAAANIDFWVFDGFSFSNPSTFDSDIFDWKLVKSIPNKKTEELEYRQNMVNLLKIHGSVDWKFEDNKLIKLMNCECNDSDTDKVMIFPSSEKYMESYQEPYFSLMTKFQELLRQPNTLLITIGFSFSDNHIFEMVMQCIKHNHSLSTLITDYSLNSKNDNWKELWRQSEVYDIHFLRAAMNTDLTDYL